MPSNESLEANVIANIAPVSQRRETALPEHKKTLEESRVFFSGDGEI
jgi:hypothetical protein